MFQVLDLVVDLAVMSEISIAFHSQFNGAAIIVFFGGVFVLN